MAGRPVGRTCSGRRAYRPPKNTEFVGARQRIRLRLSGRSVFIGGRDALRFAPGHPAMTGFVLVMRGCPKERVVQCRPILVRAGAGLYRTRPVRRARSSAGEHLLDMEGVTGSIPVAPTILRCAAAEDALRSSKSEGGQSLGSRSFGWQARRPFPPPNPLTQR